MKSLSIGSPVKLRIATAAVFAIILLISSPAMALDYDFGEVSVGEVETVALDIQNIDPNNGYTFDLSLALGSDSNFSLASSQVTVPAGGVVQVSVNFSPKIVGSCEDTLQVRLGTFLITQMQVLLTGTGIEAAPSVPEETFSPMAATFQKWNSGISSREYHGKTIGEWVQECFESSKNHGQAVNCVATLTAKLSKKGIITRKEAREMRAFAVKAKYHHKHKKQRSHFDIKREKFAYRWSNWD